MRSNWRLAIGAGLVAGTALISAAAPAHAADVTLELPTNYRTTLDNYLISDRLGQEDQVISLFANEIARDGVRANGELPYGSILVGEIYKAKKNQDGEVIDSAIGRRIPGELAAIVMMERREGWDAQYPDELKVGDWEFEVFSPSGENLARDTTACRECHHPLTESEFTFSYAHIGGAN